MAQQSSVVAEGLVGGEVGPLEGRCVDLLRSSLSLLDSLVRMGCSAQHEGQMDSVAGSQKDLGEALESSLGDPQRDRCKEEQKSCSVGSHHGCAQGHACIPEEGEGGRHEVAAARHGGHTDNRQTKPHCLTRRTVSASTRCGEGGWSGACAIGGVAVGPLARERLCERFAAWGALVAPPCCVVVRSAGEIGRPSLQGRCRLRLRKAARLECSCPSWRS